MRIVTAVHVVDELTLPQQVGNRLSGILCEAEVKMDLGGVVAPLDAVVGVQYDDAVGQRAPCLTETHERLGELLIFGAAGSLIAIDQRKNVIPRSRDQRQLVGVRLPQPVSEQLHL